MGGWLRHRGVKEGRRLTKVVVRVRFVESMDFAFSSLFTDTLSTPQSPSSSQHHANTAFDPPDTSIMSAGTADSIPTSSTSSRRRPPSSASGDPSQPARKRLALTPTTLHQTAIGQLMNTHLDRPIPLPLSSSTNSLTRTLAAPPEIVHNVQGSSAGAGSGEFHVYKAARRREMERLKRLDEDAVREKGETEFEERVVGLMVADEERTRRKREKRGRRRERGKGGGKKKGEEEGKAGEEEEVERGELSTGPDPDRMEGEPKRLEPPTADGDEVLVAAKPGPSIREQRSEIPAQPASSLQIIDEDEI